MNKSILWLIGLLFVTSLSIVSCSETDGTEDPYANWEERNQRYIDSIATVAEANQGNGEGQWKIIRSYKLPSLGLNETGKIIDNVYCKIQKVGDGTESPIATDTVAVNYRGQLINGTVFDQSYQGELDPETATPRKFLVGAVIAGWSTALMKGFGGMKAGDQWKLYIPYPLAYGKDGTEGIPGYSTLIFDVNLVDIFPLKGMGKALMIPWMLKIAIIEYWKEESIAVCCNALFYGVLIHVGWTRRGPVR